MRELIETLIYDYPRLFRTVVTLFAAALLLFVFMLLPPAPVFRAIGVTGIQTRISALYYAGFWRVRAMTNRSAVISKSDVEFGTMAGLDRSGRVIVSVPSGATYLLKTYQIADVKITDLYGAASVIGQLRTEDAKLEIYSPDQVVIWVRGAPFNVKLIESGHAVPDPSPPTNIVDDAFSTYYWRIFWGNK